MSRVGKKPISIPKEVNISLEGSKIVFKGTKLTKELETYGRVVVEIKDSELMIDKKGVEAQDRAYWGTYRALANNIVIGLTSGFQKQLEINGVGYKAGVNGKTLELALGFSHPVNYPIPDGIEIGVEKNIITISIQIGRAHV